MKEGKIELQGRAILKTFYGGPDEEPTVESFAELRECISIAASRSREGITVMIERVPEEEKSA